jgi:ParB family chromosome partitioning protein
MNTTTAYAAAVEHVDPHTLTIETNIRTVAPLDAGFVDSIRANGVLVPILARRDAEGSIHVRAGQRRTLAAREAGLATVPVYVVAEADESTATRIIEQIVENEQRENLTDVDRLAAWRALELDGLSATVIAKRTGTKRDRVKTGLAVAASDTATGAIATAGLTLDQAAVLLEFEDDPETVTDLTETATTDPDYFPVAVQRARDERQARAAREAAHADESAKGHRILNERPDWDAPTPYRLHHIHTAEGEPVTGEDIQGKPGVAVYVSTNYRGEADITYYVDDPAALGYIVADRPTSTRQKGPMTDEQKAERKTLIANNKEWDAAETVRREWIAAMLQRKTLPKNAALVIARSLTSARHRVSEEMSHGNGLAATLLGIEKEAGYYADAFSDYLDAHPTKAGHVSLAVTLGGIEASTGRDTWRHPSAETARYLQTLAGWGYTLSPVERIAAMLTDDQPTEG